MQTHFAFWFGPTDRGVFLKISWPAMMSFLATIYLKYIYDYYPSKDDTLVLWHWIKIIICDYLPTPSVCFIWNGKQSPFVSSICSFICSSLQYDVLHELQFKIALSVQKIHDSILFIFSGTKKNWKRCQDVANRLLYNDFTTDFSSYVSTR